MKKSIKSQIAKMLFVFSMFAIAALPALAQINSDGNNPGSSTMGPAGVIGSVALIIGLVIIFAAKGVHRVSHQK